jgi:hypothetical protein
MAADSRVVTSGPLYEADKIFRIGISLVGTAGDGFMSLAFIEWFRSPRRSMHALHKMIPIEHRDEIYLIELRPGGIHLWNGWGVAERIHNTFYAIGSGSMVAVAGMKYGMTPGEAVRSAMDWDENTGGKIQVETLVPAKPKRKRG